MAVKPTDDGATSRRSATAQPAERAFAGNLKTLRTARGMSQQAFAEAMDALGFRWHQATVYKVESGARQVLLGEAKAASDVLGVQLQDMTNQFSDSLAEIAPIQQMLRLMPRSSVSVHNSSYEYETERVRLRRLYTELPAESKALLDDVERGLVESFLATSAPEFAGNGEREARATLKRRTSSDSDGHDD